MLQFGGETAAATAESAVKDATTQSFTKDVIEESKKQPVLVDFWAPWCGPCKQLGPILEKVVKAAKGKVKLVKMDIDQHPEIPGQMGIQSIPAVIAFLERLTKGKIVDEGADQLKAADDALTAGNAAEAADLYAKILAGDSGNIAALAGLARCYVATGNIEQAKKTLAIIPEAKHNDVAVAAARAALELAEQAQSIGPADELQKKVDADPLDHQSRFELAAALNAQNKRAEAADHLLAIVKRDRKWNEDGARKQLVQFFDAWGPTDPATLEGRKRLSSILFS